MLDPSDLLIQVNFDNELVYNNSPTMQVKYTTDHWEILCRLDHEVNLDKIGMITILLFNNEMEYLLRIRFKPLVFRLYELICFRALSIDGCILHYDGNHTEINIPCHNSPITNLSITQRDLSFDFNISRYDELTSAP